VILGELQPGHPSKSMNPNHDPELAGLTLQYVRASSQVRMCTLLVAVYWKHYPVTMNMGRSDRHHPKRSEGTRDVGHSFRLCFSHPRVGRAP